MLASLATLSPVCSSGQIVKHVEARPVPPGPGTIRVLGPHQPKHVLRVRLCSVVPSQFTQGRECPAALRKDKERGLSDYRTEAGYFDICHHVPRPLGLAIPARSRESAPFVPSSQMLCIHSTHVLTAQTPLPLECSPLHLQLSPKQFSC